jgi:hypothetical protein
MTLEDVDLPGPRAAARGKRAGPGRKARRRKILGYVGHALNLVVESLQKPHRSIARAAAVASESDARQLRKV